MLGGALGAGSRYGVYVLQSKAGLVGWVPTLTVNLVGCFLLGMLIAQHRQDAITDQANWLWIVGFLGSFTTFSTFAMDYTHMQTTKPWLGLTYILLSVGFGLMLFQLGCGLSPKNPSTPGKVKRMDHTQSKFGITWVDPYAWVRDKKNPEVIALLNQENKKTEKYFKPIKSLEDDVYNEIVSRINEEDQSYPYPHGGYTYYSKIAKGENYQKYYRKKNDTQELLLDMNAIAKDKDFVELHDFEVSPSHNLLAYTLDFNGSESYTIFVKDLKTGKIIDATIEDSTGSIEWGPDDASFYYGKRDHTQRPFQVYLYQLGQGESKHVKVFQDDELSNFVGFDKTMSERFLIISSDNKLSSEVHFIDFTKSQTQTQRFAPRQENVLMSIDHHQDSFIIHTNEDAIDFKVLKAPIENHARSHWETLIPHQRGRFITDVDVFKDFWVIWQRGQGSQSLEVYDPVDKSLTPIPIEEAVYDLSAQYNMNFDTDVYRFGFSAMKTPYTILERNIKSEKTHTLHVKKVPGPFKKDDYVVEKTFAPSRDGKTMIPISIIKPKSFKLDGQGKLFLYAYGSYGHTVDPGFSVSRLSLVDRGFAFAIAHIRGSSVNGRSWYEDGKFLNKKNTFNDFIDSAEHLIAQQYTQPKNIAIRGGSAGGLLMGAVLNARPDLWGAVIASVPFVDVINTMLDADLPLTVTEYDEWGNPNEEVFFKYMMDYAPYENIKDNNFPPILATGGLNDPRVGFWEPTKWVLKLRDHQKAKYPILLKVEMGAGHGGPSGRYAAIRDIAGQYAFALDTLDKKD